MSDYEFDLCDDCIRPPEACSDCENGSMFVRDDFGEDDSPLDNCGDMFCPVCGVAPHATRRSAMRRQGRE